jgi:HD-GYP domain-containing protein (c-di-GMP phosphodiesterase class II)
MDSKGYPDGINAQELDFFTRLVSVCDSYERITSNRLRRQKTSFNRAVDIILQGCGTAFDSDAVHSFVRCIGRYPVGSFVLLSSGEVAVVVETNPAAVLCPVVSRITDTRLEQRNMPERLDLNVVHEVGITSSIGGQYVV